MPATAPLLTSLASLAVLSLACALPDARAAAAADAGDCLPLADDQARLACYDRVHRRDAASVTPSSTSAPAAVPEPVAAQASTPEPATTASVFDQRWDLGGGRGRLFYPSEYKPVYLLPATWTDQVNTLPSSPAPEHSVTQPLELRATEAKYQISFKSKLSHGVLGTPVALWGAYTQSSRWQVYNGAVSRPFRETNYEPELIAGLPLDQTLLGWRLRQAALSLNHQSNGRSLPLSRSWNRVIAELRAERGPWALELRPWWRLAESDGDDDNPDIEDHVGRAELLLTRQFGADHVGALQLRHSLRGGERSRGSAQLEWFWRIEGSLHLYAQWYGGYGESLIDYNHRQHKIGLGLSIVGWR